VGSSYDAIALEHTIKIYHHLPRGQLFIMPGATHSGAYEKPNLFNQVLQDFFNQPWCTVWTMQQYADQALFILREFPQGPMLASLEELIHFTTSGTKWYQEMRSAYSKNCHRNC